MNRPLSFVESPAPRGALSEIAAGFEALARGLRALEERETLELEQGTRATTKNLTVPAIAKTLEMSESLVRREIRLGRLKAEKYGIRCYRVTEKELEAYRRRCR